jgi:DNA-binding LacI/PurR family transcriptional regulator
MNYLLQLGHRAVGLINAAPEVRTAVDRHEVYEEKFLAAGITPLKGWYCDGRFTEEGGAAAAEAILKTHPEVTALFAGNDKMAIGAMHYLHRSGMKVPQDISVVGFDDMHHSAFVTPSLTTVHLPLYEAGVTACDRLIERILGKTETVAEILPTYLVVRESTALAKNV